jgi:hypothetical protein
LLAVLATLGGAPSAGAQTVLGSAPNAFVVPRGVLRLGVSQEWGSYDDAFGGAADSGSRRAPLGSRFSSDRFGAAQIAAFVPAERDLRQLVGDGAFAVSLGATRVSSSVSTRTTAIELDAGVGRGISLGVVVPVVRTLAAVGISVDPRGDAANVGFNPARLAATASAAAARNALVIQQFDAARAQLRQQFPSCFTAAGAPTGGTGCGPATTLHQSAATYAATLARVYGTGTTTARRARRAPHRLGRPARGERQRA